MLFYGPQLGGWGWLPGLSFLVFWALLAVIIFALARSFTRSGRRPFGPRPGYPSPPGPYGPGPGPGPGSRRRPSRSWPSGSPAARSMRTSSTSG